MQIRQSVQTVQTMQTGGTGRRKAPPEFVSRQR